MKPARKSRPRRGRTEHAPSELQRGKSPRIFQDRNEKSVDHFALVQRCGEVRQWLDQRARAYRRQGAQAGAVQFAARGVTRPSAPANPRALPGHSPAIDQRNAAAARAAAQPPIAPAVPGAGRESMSYEQKRLAQDQQLAASRGGR
jgi:hypothetical protein